MLVFIVLSGGGGGKGKEEEKENGKKPTTADLNVALIKMACTQGEEKYKPRNVLFLSFFSFIVHVCFGCSHPFSSLSVFYFSFLSSPFFFFMSPISFPTPFLFLFSFYFLAEEVQCLCIKVTTGMFAVGWREKQGYSSEMK